jgi:hypothetical protein
MPSAMNEALYLLSIELVILYVAAFGLLALKTDTMFSAGMAYSAVLCTFVLAYLLPALALLFAGVGSLGVRRAAMASVRGAAVFQVAAFLLFVLLVTSLWASPLVCVHETETSALCHVRGDATAQKIDAADVRFAFPSRAQYLEYAELANASVADVFLKSGLSENEFVTKLHAVVGLPFALIVLVVQSAFFYAVSGLEDEAGSHGFTVSGLYSLFVRCALLLLCIVIDSADFFCYWNVVDVGPQMLPSLAFTALLVLSDFGDSLLENMMDAWESRLLCLFVCLAETSAAGIYALFAALVACHYVVGGVEFMQDFIADTRWTTVHVLFVVFLLLDACSALARAMWKTHAQWRKHAKPKSTADDGPKQGIAKIGPQDSTLIEPIGMNSNSENATFAITNTKEKSV